MRRQFAENLRERLEPRSDAIVEAFATVPRERFLGPGPWLLLAGNEGYSSTPDADPRRVYQDFAIAIDAQRMLNNGQPGLLAGVIEALALRPGHHVVHIGCGTGYYSAILAHLVGRTGSVTALELDPQIAARARRNLRPWKQARVVMADALEHDFGPADAILVQAGVTAPRPLWLDRLRSDARMAVPLTAVRPPAPVSRFLRNHAGAMLLISRRPRGLEARFLGPVGIPALFGGRDPEHQRALAEAFSRGDTQQVRSLRREAHPRDAACWLHARDFCLSRRPVGD